MVWVISIAVFLAIVVAALLVFLMYSQKEKIEKALKERRAEERAKLEIEVEVATAHETPVYEKYSTENTSRHGARILTSKQWQQHGHVLVRLPFRNEPSDARIIYCDTLPTNAFAVGLKFSSPVNDWLESDDGMSSDERPYRK